MSDLHFEFYDFQQNDRFVKSLDPSLTDVLVVAGDVGPFHICRDALIKLCRHYAPKPVIFVAGNHEYYGRNFVTADARELLDGLLADIDRDFPNFYWLDQGTADIDGQRFVGCTLWYDDIGRRDWSDYRHIIGFENWGGRESREHVNFLASEIKEGDVVVTHMLPSLRCVHERWKQNEDNCFFVREMGYLMQKSEPALWLFGHTHDRIDTTIYKTRCLCNPRAYPHEQPDFDPKLIIEV